MKLKRKLVSLILAAAVALPNMGVSIVAADERKISVDEVNSSSALWVEDKTTEDTAEGLSAYWADDTTSDTALTAMATGEFSYAVEGGNIYYNSEGEITDCDETVTSAVIPSEIGGVKITAIGDIAFCDCINLTSISIPNSITEIGDTAFKYCKLTNISIPDSVTVIGDWAFYGCSSLTSVSIPDGVTEIGSRTFHNCSSLTSVSIPDSVVEIGYGAFCNCSSLTSISIPDTVTYIGASAFYGCSSLTSVKIPNGITEIVDETFRGCSSLTSISIPDSVTNIGTRALSGCNSLTNINIPNSVTNIGAEAFSSCSGLTGLIIPNSVVKIEYQAFKGCRGLTSISIPDSVTEIGFSAFDGCISLVSVSIPGSVTCIDTGTFRDCSGLISVNISDGVTKIDYSAFEGCSSLTNVSIPDSITIIDSYTFSNCKSLIGFSIPDSVTEIGYHAFLHCDSLTYVYIPNGVTNIANSAFYGCDSLTDVYYESSEAEWNAISIGSENFALTNATIHYNSTAPEDTGDGSIDYEQSILENMSSIVSSLYFKYLLNNENFNHVMLMVSNDSSMGLYIDAVGKFIFSGSDGIKDLLSSATSIEDAEGILIGFLEENDEEISALAEAKSKSKICGIINDSLKGYIQYSTLSTDEMKAINSVLDSDELNKIFEDNGFDGLMNYIGSSLKSMGVSDDADVMTMLDDFKTSSQLQSDLSTGLNILNAGLKVIDLTKMSVDMLTDYYTLQTADEIYIEILEYLEDNAIFEVTQIAAHNVRVRATQNIDEAMNEINLELAKEGGTIVAEEVWNSLIDTVWFLKAAKTGMDIGVNFSNTFFHTADGTKVKDSMRNLTYIGNALSSYISENAALYAQNIGNESEAVYYSERVIYGLRMLYKTRVLGEECYSTFCDYFNRDKMNVGINQSILRAIDREWFGEDGVITNFKTLLVSCPVDVEIYDSDGNKVLTVYDGAEASGETDNIIYSVIYSANTDDYIKVINIPEDEGYYFKAIGKDLGRADCIVASINEETGLMESKGSYNIPVDKNTTIESSDIDNDNITLTIEDAKGTDTFEMEDAFNTNYVELTGIGFDDDVMEMNIGGIKRLNFNYSPTNATNPVVYWSSSDENIVKVNSDGIVKAVGEGSAVITLKSFDDTLEDNIVINVKNGFLYGDTNADGIISAMDCSELMQKVLDASFITGIEEAGGDYVTYLDVNADGTVTAADASVILQKTLDNSFTMPCEE